MKIEISDDLFNKISLLLERCKDKTSISNIDNIPSPFLELVRILSPIFQILEKDK